MPFLRLSPSWLALLVTLLLAQSAEAGNLTIAWDPPSDPTTTGHILWWGTQSRTYSHRLDIGLKTSYTVTGLTDGVVYYFALTAYNAAGQSSVYSEEISTAGAIGAPRNLVGTALGRTIQLQWDSPAQGGAFNYRLEAGSAPGKSDLGTIVVPSVTSFAAPSVPDGTYFVRVRAIKAGVTGPASNELRIVVGSTRCAASPGAPHTLTASATGIQVVVRWQPGPGERPTAYLLEAGSKPGLRDLATISVAGTSFSTPAPAGKYYLRVRSVNTCGTSPTSNEVSVTVNDPAGLVPSAPVDVVQSVSGTTVALTWRPGPSGGVPRRYLIEATGAGGNPIGTIDMGSATGFRQSGIPPGVYIVRVRAANAAGIGPPSVPVTVAVGKVDCATSAWTLTSQSAWGACTGGKQTRTETWTRTVITPPANGGAACGPLSETRTGTQACTLPSGNLITLAPSTVHQTMRGWEAVANASQYAAGFASFAPRVYDQAVASGINRVRLEVRAGSENTTDSYGNWAAAGFPASGTAYTTWRAKRYETINDNADPNVLNPGGFHFTELDETIDLVVLPMRQRLAAKGESLYVNLNYVAFTRQITSGLYIHNQTAEYAEFMLATFQHLQQRYGWVPDAIELILEPDNVPQWNGTLVGQAIVATAQKLAAHGFTPDFIAPSTTSMANAVTWFDKLIAVPNVKTYLNEIAYHRYSGVSTTNLQAIASRAQAHGLSTAMLEWWSSGNSYHVLHEDLKVGRNSAWEQGTLASVSAAHTSLLHVDAAGNVKPGPVTRYAQQYYQHIRRGAKRIGASSSASAFDPLAFVNPNGRYTVVVKAASSGSFSVQGLPAGTYGIRYTTATQSANHADQTISSGQSLNTGIAAAGVITIYKK